MTKLLRQSLTAYGAPVCETIADVPEPPEPASVPRMVPKEPLMPTAPLDPEAMLLEKIQPLRSSVPEL